VTYYYPSISNRKRLQAIIYYILFDFNTELYAINDRINNNNNMKKRKKDAVTNNFLAANKFGGGFGLIYKVYMFCFHDEHALKATTKIYINGKTS
jgi:hypothetical protein